jgi:hypothetical protein
MTQMNFLTPFTANCTKEDIVLAFHEPKVGQYTDFAVPSAIASGTSAIARSP